MDPDAVPHRRRLATGKERSKVHDGRRTPARGPRAESASAAERAIADQTLPCSVPTRSGSELVVHSPAEPPSDATNYLGGIGDVLEVKDRRGALPHLGELAHVALYLNDRQIHEVELPLGAFLQTRYSVRIWKL